MAPRSKDQFVVITWKENTMFLVNRETVKIEETLSMPRGPKEGWGITSIEDDGKEYYTMYISDGTSKIYKMHGESLQVVSQITVRDKRTYREIDQLNELEYVDGYIYANVWYSTDILKIDPATGMVVKKWDLSALKKAEVAYQQAE